MRRKFLSLLLLVSFLFTLIPCTAFASSKVFEVNGKKYNLIDGSFYSIPMLVSKKPRYLHFYYSDGFFEKPSKEYSEHLATMSINLAMAGSSPRQSEDRKYRSDIAYKMLADIGCSDQNMYINDELLVEPTSNSIGVIISSKELFYADGSKTGYTLMPVVIRSSGYNSEWAGNFTVGTEGEAKGFAIAANKALAEIEKYLRDFGLESQILLGKVKIWITGYSRGGAVTNLTAKRLIERYGANAVYAYAFEAPIAGRKEEIKKGIDYSSIHNVTNYGDLVPLMPPANGDYAFIHYGTEHSFPAADNKSYQEQIKAMKAQLNIIASDNDYSDDFEIYRFLVNLDPFQIGMVPIENPNGFSPNKILGDWLRGFMTQLVNWNVPTRNEYENKTLVLGDNTYPSLQDAMIEFFNVLFEADDDTINSVLKKIGDLANNDKKLDLTNLDLNANDLAMLLNIVSNWESKKEINPKTKEQYLFELWDMVHSLNLLEEGQLSEEQASRLKAIWPTIANIGLNFIYQDLHTEATDVAKELGYDINDKATFLFTMLNNPKAIIINHDFDINLAWLRSFDSLYKNDVSNPVGNVPSKVESPEAMINGTALGKTIDSSSKAKPGDKVILDTQTLKGEMIFYKLDDLMDDKDIPTETIYRGGIKLPDKASSYKITAYSRYETVNSNEVSYFVNTF